MDISIHNKSNRPDNIVEREERVIELAEKIEKSLPSSLREFFLYLRGGVLPLSRLAYLRDIKFFFDYLVHEIKFCEAKDASGITMADLGKLKAKDINHYLDHVRRYKKESNSGSVTVYNNGNKSLARKRASLSVLFKYLYRNELIEQNISDGFDPIRLPKATDREIKALTDDEVMRMLDIVSSGEGLTKKQKVYFAKTKKRDRAILMFFLTYGLRITELVGLNLSSFNFSRGEFTIFRKRGKEATMPLNNSAINALREYIDSERSGIAIKNERDSDALFISLHGSRLTDRQVREMVKKYTAMVFGKDKAEGYSPHKLRATAATSLIERGESIYDVQALLNHENIQTTQLYAMHRKQAKRDLVKNFEWDEKFDK
jgi:site-specific recombinase XerD